MNPPGGFFRYLKLAGRYLSLGRIPVLLAAVGRKDDRRLGSARDQLALLAQLVGAVWRGEYKGLSRQALVAAVAALIYFVSPLDAIPDWLLAVGFLDDIAVLGWVMTSWKRELEAFRAWRDGRGEASSSASTDSMAVIGNRENHP